MDQTGRRATHTTRIPTYRKKFLLHDARTQTAQSKPEREKITKTRADLRHAPCAAERASGGPGSGRSAGPTPPRRNPFTPPQHPTPLPALSCAWNRLAWYKCGIGGIPAARLPRGQDGKRAGSGFLGKGEGARSNGTEPYLIVCRVLSVLVNMVHMCEDMSMRQGGYGSRAGSRGGRGSGLRPSAGLCSAVPWD